MLASAMQNRLTEEGWLFSQASVCDNAGGGCDFTHLDVAFSRSVDLVVSGSAAFKKTALAPKKRLQIKKSTTTKKGRENKFS